MSSNQYLLFNKPDGVLTTFTDEEGRETLKDYVDVTGVYSAGRLDRASEGLLLLTDDGELIHRITDPRHHIEKTYLVQVEGEPTEEALETLRRGVLIQGERTRPCRVSQVDEPLAPPRRKPLTPHGPTNWLQIMLREGKKHQVRHMTASVGLPTLRLLRTAIGPLTVAGLQPGQWRWLTEDEICSLNELLKGSVSSSSGSRRRKNRAVPTGKKKRRR